MLLVNRNEKVNEFVIIVGKFCEFGDIIVWDVLLFFFVYRGDYLVIFFIGVYYYLMVLNYN